ncbi:hypothetical protein SUGI_0496020 [Cryptomeria japonica]|nr:hypothetical protein SUGI_0496020 [Cryptomeria japonica]
MEGLIPYIYKAVINHRSHDEYRRTVSWSGSNGKHSTSFARLLGQEKYKSKSGRLDVAQDGEQFQADGYSANPHHHRFSISCFS